MAEKSNFMAAIFAAMPLSVAVVPWGILVGTLGIEAGLTGFQTQLTSLLVFAGAAQISGIAILGAGGTWASLLNTTTMISVRHVLYSATYKDNIAPLPLWKRILFAFLLTDEMFAIAQTEQIKTGKFDYWYAIVAGFTFYLVWNLATFAGIVASSQFENISEMGFDFAIAATFIAMVVPMIRDGKTNRNTLFIAALVSAVMTLVFELMQVKESLMFAGLIGMAVGAVLSSKSGVDTMLSHH